VASERDGADAIGELGRSIEQPPFGMQRAAYSVGFVRGVSRTLRRTATGLV